MIEKDYRQYSTPLSHRICDKLELPEDAFTNCSHIEIISNCCALVEGCKGILEYDDTVIKLDLGKNSVSFGGSSLTIKSLSLEQAVVEGFIVSIEFGG